MAEYTSSQLMHMEHEFGAHNYHPLEVVIARAEGVWVWDPEGNKYMDCLAAYSAVNQGHRHPRIIQALKDQADRLTLTSRAFFNDRWPLFARKLARTVGKEMVLPMNTGAEAVETAIKLARRWGYEKKGVPAEKAEIIVMCENFHGRTTTIISFSTDDVARSNYGPYTPGFKLVPYNDVEAVRAAVNANTVAVLVEPIQGEAGVMVPDDGYLRGLREVCDNSNTLLICDEVQTGFCRTGKLFAFEYEGIVPDIIIMGKALGGGVYPVSAIAADKAIMEVFTPGSHGSTFGGNPLACAVAEASIDVLLDEDLAGNALRLGEYFRENLRSMNSPKVDIVRGKGLLNAVVMNREAGKARQYTSALKDAGVLAKETHDWIIRFAPPLTVTRDELDWALERIRTVLA